ncbi:hypothetical protein L1887_30263 [Cichorium endivia]|nr:hypothetical protein L1887_30263 [Cichorium endivia]
MQFVFTIGNCNSCSPDRFTIGICNSCQQSPPPSVPPVQRSKGWISNAFFSSVPVTTTRDVELHTDRYLLLNPGATISHVKGVLPSEMFWIRSIIIGKLLLRQVLVKMVDSNVRTTF